jgi:hypothetical protein
LNRLIPLLFALAIVAGCGGSDKAPEESGHSTSNSAAPTTAVPKQNVTADRAAAEAAVLKLADMPSGWTSSPVEDDASDNLNKRLADCLGVTVSELNAKSPASVDSPDFSDPDDNQTVSNTVAFLGDVGAVTRRLDLLSGPKVPACFSEAVTSEINDRIEHPESPADTLPKGSKIGDATVAEMSFPNLGDRTVAYRVTVPITVSGLSIKLHLDTVAVGKGRAGVSLQFQGVGAPFPTEDAQKYAQLVLSRVDSGT